MGKKIKETTVQFITQATAHMHFFGTTLMLLRSGCILRGQG